MEDTVISTVGSGESVFFSYDGAQNACEQISKISKDIKDKLEIIRTIINQKDQMWKGEAASRFWEEFLATGKEYSLEEIENITSVKIPQAVEGVIELIDQNKTLDSELMSTTFIDPSANDNIQSSEVTTDAYGVDEEGNNAVNANDNIQSNEVTTDAHGVDEELDNSVHANDNVQSNTAVIYADGVDQELDNSVHTEDNIQSSQASTDARSIDMNKLDSVQTSGAFAGTPTADTTVSTDTSAYDKITSMFAENN